MSFTWPTHCRLGLGGGLDPGVAVLAGVCRAGPVVQSAASSMPRPKLVNPDPAWGPASMTRLGKPADLQPEVGDRALRPLVAQLLARRRR